jgi:hypothetical protein
VATIAIDVILLLVYSIIISVKASKEENKTEE